MARHSGKPFSRSRLVSGRAWPDLSSAWGRPAPVLIRPLGTLAAAAALDRIRAPACWSPADGDVILAGRPGRDRLVLPGIGLVRLLAALDLDDPRLSLHLDAEGAVRFLGPEGESVHFGGALMLDGATLRFTGMACLLLG
ncbi:hypothetical protein ACLF3G_07005 [Falsiroseomonas sp. HC035]|uniref:hypothetical protein n=1 Tax=Falsiroseomonas sp. HC035 TaxID=3390999 RepID=UPI003D322832